MMKFIFGMQIKINVFYKLKVSFLVMLSILVCAARHAQSTRNKKFVLSMQYLKQNVNDEVDFLPEDKHQRFLPIDTIILGVCAKACPNFWLLVTRLM